MADMSAVAAMMTNTTWMCMTTPLHVAVVALVVGASTRLVADRSPGVEALFRKLRSFVVVLWLVHPVIRVLGPVGVGTMDAETTPLVVAYIDIVSKVGFGLIAVNDCVKMAAVRDERDGSADAGEHEVPADGAPVAGD